MPVDVATRSFLDMLQASGGKPLHELSPAEARAAVTSLSRELGGPPADVHSVSDRPILGAGHKIALRIYTPRPATDGALLPILLQYHGGGFVAGDLDSHDIPSRYYCKNADAIVVAVDYGRSPEHKFPTAVEDSYAALCWAAEHAHEMGGDRGRLAVTGDSAGGNLGAVVCQLAKARGGPRIMFQALVYPAVDMSDSSDYPSRGLFGGGDYFLSAKDMDWFKSLYLNNAAEEVKDPRCSPIVARDLAGLPPALVITAGFDLLRDEGKAYADRLAAAGVPVEYQCFDGTIHAFVSFAGVIPAGEQAMSLIAQRLKTALHH